MKRRQILNEKLSSQKLDGLLCFVPENVLFLSSYWPSTSYSSILYTIEHEPVLIIPFSDERFIPASWEGEVIVYKTGLNYESPDKQLINSIKDIIAEKKYKKLKLGCDKSMETVAGTHIGGEIRVPGIPFYRMLEESLPDIKLTDQTSLLKDLRMRKTKEEIASMKKCNDIVAYALSQAKENLHEGMKESELASIIESSIQTYGIGYSSVKRTRGYAFPMSGKDNSASAWWMYNITTDRVIKKGDLIVIEIDTHADGYWSDISRTFIVGEPNRKQQEIMDVILKSLNVTVESLNIGMSTSSIDGIARNVIQEAGYGEYFLHHVGHGVGFSFHERPYLDPESNCSSDYKVEAGMVLAIEPGIYIPNWGGVRVEDNVVITEKGKAEYLIDFKQGY